MKVPVCKIQHCFVILQSVCETRISYTCICDIIVAFCVDQITVVCRENQIKGFLEDICPGFYQSALDILLLSKMEAITFLTYLLLFFFVLCDTDIL
jgi:hypothetical protein